MPLSNSEYAMLAAFRFKLRQFLAFSERAAASVGLTQQQYQVLLAVRAHPGPEPVTISELAREMLVKHHSAVGMVNRLEELRMVRREPSPADRRKVGIRLTANGMRVFEKLVKIHRGELRRFGHDVGRLMAYFGSLAGEPPARGARATRANRGRGARS